MSDKAIHQLQRNALDELARILAEPKHQKWTLVASRVSDLSHAVAVGNMNRIGDKLDLLRTEHPAMYRRVSWTKRLYRFWFDQR